MGGTFGAAVVLPDLGEAFLTAASPDALLLTLCAEAMRLDQAAEALSGAEEDAALRQWFVVAGQIAATPSRTPTGVRAKAGIVRHLMTPTARLPEGYEGKWDEGAVYGPLTWSLVNDLAAVA